jgi:hypothetical protein
VKSDLLDSSAAGDIGALVTSRHHREGFRVM